MRDTYYIAKADGSLGIIFGWSIVCNEPARPTLTYRATTYPRKSC